MSFLNPVLTKETMKNTLKKMENATIWEIKFNFDNFLSFPGIIRSRKLVNF